MIASSRTVLSWVILAIALVAFHPGNAHAIAYTLNMDLTDGILFHNSPTFTHPVDPPGFVFSDGRKEIEDNYFSPTINFPGTRLHPADPTSNQLSLTIRFADKTTGVQQFLLPDAKGTTSPFPETFAIRLPGPPTHTTIGPGMFFFGPQGSGTVGGIADGTVTTMLGTLIGSPAINGYTVPLRCFIDNCTTGPHFPNSMDLTDASFGFGSLTLDVRLTQFERCALFVPNCGGITLGGFGFGMLAGDLSVIAPVAVPEPSAPWLIATGFAAMVWLATKSTGRRFRVGRSRRR
jgi:hypothetical protein